MRDPLDSGRRRFLSTATMALAAVGVMGTPEASEAESRQLAAFTDATGWVGSAPLSPSSLSGKVVLVQFGTYTCINWLRTLPYVRAWAQRYDKRLTVVGVHTPEFEFEKNLTNVRRAVEQLKLGYPIAIDNDYAIWRGFDNRYWPALYLIDARGRVRHHHFGEGGYEQSQRAIQQVVAEAGSPANDEGAVAVTATGIELPADWRSLKTPEIYLGYARSEAFSSPGGAALGRRRVYSVPSRLALNRWAHAGEWAMSNQATVLHAAGGRIVCRFHARDVHLVMGPPRQGTPVRFRVLLDEQPPGPAHGLDVDDSGAGRVVEQRLYQLVRQPGPIAERTFAIEFLEAGVEAFAFTFG